MNKVKILVVEDEVIIADNLCDTLDELNYETLEPAINYTEALEIISEETPDIAILDIELGGRKTGIDLAVEIKKKYDFPFIFLTSNADAATLEKAKKVNPSGYLVKPFTKEELYTTIEIALHNYSEKISDKSTADLIVKNAFFIKEKGIFQKINFDDILYLKSEHVYTELVLVNDTKQVIRVSLNSIIDRLNSDFIRVHRSYIINANYLSQIDKTALKVNNAIIPIGDKYKADFLKRINLI